MSIEYDRTVMYRIVCLNSEVKDEYVGSTTDYVGRKRCHKSDCMNDKKSIFNSPLYACIRNNGGWANWKMMLIENFPCQNNVEKIKREKYWQDYYKPSLNINTAYISPEELKMQQKEKYLANRVELIEKAKDYYQKNKVKILARLKEQRTK